MKGARLLVLTLFAVAGTALVSASAAAQACTERCQFIQTPSDTGWACMSGGTNKNCVATQTQCTITMCGGTGGTKVYTSISLPGTRELAFLERCAVVGATDQTVAVLYQALSAVEVPMRVGNTPSRFLDVAGQRLATHMIGGGGL